MEQNKSFSTYRSGSNTGIQQLYVKKLLIRVCLSLFDGFYSNFGVLWEEDEHLIRGVVVMSNQNREIRPIRTTLAAHAIPSREKEG